MKQHPADPADPAEKLQPLLSCFDLGIADYEPIQALQGRLRWLVAAGACPGVLLLLEHNPVVTLGRRADAARSLVPGPARARRLPVVRCERGGLATLHAPGQLVAYPVIPVPRRNLRAYVWGLEEAARRFFLAFGVNAHRVEGKPGLYVGKEKIASLGLRCERWVASHGISLNISPNLQLFEGVVSCGDPGLVQTSIAKICGTAPGMAEAKATYATCFAAVFSTRVLPPVAVSPAELENLVAGWETTMPTAGFEPAAPGSGGQCSIP